MGEKKKGAVPGFVHREEHFVSDQPQLDWKEETVTGGAGEQRAEGGPGGAGSPPCQFAVLLGHLQWGSWLFCLLGC